MAALGAHENPSRAEEVFRGLARLEVVGYKELRLRYELDGRVRIRDEAVSFLAVRQEREGRRRNIGTAHLEIDPATGEPHWFVFGPQLAQFLSVPTQADAFALLLQSGRADRERFLAARRIGADAVEGARIKLKVVPDDDLLEDLVVGALSGASGNEGSGERGLQTPSGAEQPLSEPATASEVGPAAELHLPSIHFENVEVIDGTTVASEVHLAGGGVSGGGLGPAGPVDFARRAQLQRLIGRRGEETVYNAERRRVAQAGFDPDAVVWRSERHPYAPYDIESLDHDGQRIHIEVKATASDDPSEPFEISEPELRCALREAERYFIYRVTLAATATPLVTRYADPLRLVRLGHAELRLSGARLAFRQA